MPCHIFKGKQSLAPLAALKPHANRAVIIGAINQKESKQLLTTKQIYNLTLQNFQQSHWPSHDSAILSSLSSLSIPLVRSASSHEIQWIQGNLPKILHMLLLCTHPVPREYFTFAGEARPITATPGCEEE
jgi:hypothetical protein